MSIKTGKKEEIMAPVVNVKRFSRSKVDNAAPAAATTSDNAPIVHHHEANNEDNEDNDFVPYSNNNNNDDDGIFLDLGRSAWEDKEKAAEAAVVDNEQQKKMAKEEAKENAAMEKKLAALQKKAMAKASKPTTATTTTRAAPAEDDNGIFADQGSEILGRDKRQLITKVVQYKQLFPTQLKTFKVKKNPSVLELREALTEMQTIVETSSLDEFVIDSILATLKLVEGVSSYSSHVNITGLAEMLRLNPQFNSLIKQLYIKYNTFSNVPPEQQLFILVLTTSYVAIQKNKNRSKIESFLNEPVLP